MLKMSAQVETVVNAYKTIAKIPSVVSARVNKAGNRISSKWSTRNLDRGKMTKYLYNYTLDEKLNVTTQSDFGTDASNELLSAVSPTESLKAVIREVVDAKDGKKQYLEVWRANILAHSINLNALDLHGDVYADSEFSSLDWSPDENHIMYVAERTPPKVEPYIKRAPIKPPNGSGESPVTKGEEYVYKQDWGEQLVGKHLSVIVVCTLDTESFSILKGLPDTWCPGQVRFAPDGHSVLGVAWETEPRRLGLIFCTNRPGYIFNLGFDGAYRKVSSEGLAVRSPRLSSGGDRLVWLQRVVGGPHHACHQLVSTAWPLQDKVEVRVLIDIVQTSIEIEKGDRFYGIYSLALPRNCFTKDDKGIVFSTPQQTEVCSYVLSLENNKIVDISNKVAPGSTSVLDVKSDIVVAVWSNVTTPGQIIVARLPTPGNELLWQPVTEAVEVASLKRTLVKYLHLNCDSDDSVKSFNAIVTFPHAKDGKKLPLIVWPHGGPHSGFVNTFSLENAFFAELGLATLQVNYRGSTGSGQASVDFLPCNVGTTDVRDCKQATGSVAHQYPVDAQNVFLFGGSHGGFLVTHLSGQYPDAYTAVVSRNPVIDVASMFNSSDIPDWCAVEAGFEFTERGAPSAEELLAMRSRSPLCHVHKVKAPTALMLGSIDKRVPHYQGLEYYRRLKANGCKAKLYMYEDNHSLSSLPVEMDNLINSANWFLQHMK